MSCIRHLILQKKYFYFYFFWFRLAKIKFLNNRQIRLGFKIGFGLHRAIDISPSAAYNFNNRFL